MCPATAHCSSPLLPVASGVDTDKGMTRAPCKAMLCCDAVYGFMPGKSCIDPDIFILCHLADMPEAGQGNIFDVAFAKG